MGTRTRYESHLDIDAALSEDVALSQVRVFRLWRDSLTT